MVCETRKNISQVHTKLASRGFHHYKVTTWPDVYDGEMVSVVRETDPNSLQHDRYACSVKRIKEGRGVLMARLVTVGHVPLEISKICHYFIIHGGEISGTAEDSKPRRSPIPSGGLEIKLNLTFKGRGDLIDKLKLLLRDAYNWDYTGEQTQDEGNDNEDDDNEENDF